MLTATVSGGSGLVYHLLLCHATNTICSSEIIQLRSLSVSSLYASSNPLSYANACNAVQPLAFTERTDVSNGLIK